MIFKLRGRDKDQIMAALRAKRTAEGTGSAPKSAKRALVPPLEEKVIPLSASLEYFWAAGDELETLRFTLTAPDVDAIPVKQLGEPAFGVARPGFIPQMSAAYAAVTRAALAQALGE